MIYALVTGASTGIGRAIALAFGSKGCYVYLVARRTKNLSETKKLIEKAGGQADIIRLDLRDIAAISNLSKSIQKLDILVNVAGIWHGDDNAYSGIKFEDYDRQTILDTYTVGFTAPSILVHDLLPVLKNRGMILNISGTFENGAKGWLPYFASKRALEDFTKGLSDDLRDSGIQVYCLSPSDTATEEYIKFFPDDAKDANKPEDIANLALRLYTDRPRQVFWVVKKGAVSSDGYHR